MENVYWHFVTFVRYRSIKSINPKYEHVRLRNSTRPLPSLKLEVQHSTRIATKETSSNNDFTEMAKAVFQFLLMLVALASVISFRPTNSRINQRRSNSVLSMGFMDILNKAMANDPSLPPAVNPGLRLDQ